MPQKSHKKNYGKYWVWWDRKWSKKTLNGAKINCLCCVKCWITFGKYRHVAIGTQTELSTSTCANKWNRSLTFYYLLILSFHRTMAATSAIKKKKRRKSIILFIFIFYCLKNACVTLLHIHCERYDHKLNWNPIATIILIFTYKVPGNICL